MSNPIRLATDTQDDREALRERIQTIMDEHIGASSWSGDAEVHGVPEAIDAILAALPLQEREG